MPHCFGQVALQGYPTNRTAAAAAAAEVLGREIGVNGFLRNFVLVGPRSPVAPCWDLKRESPQLLEGDRLDLRNCLVVLADSIEAFEVLPGQGN